MSGGYLMHTPFGIFCTVCQSPVGFEEIDWDECDTCGGEGVGESDALPDEYGDEEFPDLPRPLQQEEKTP